MKYPKVTNSKDGNKRMSVKIEFRISIEDLKIAFGEIINSECNLPITLDPFKDPCVSEKILENISKAEIFNKCKFLLWNRGESMWAVAENWYPHRNSIEGFVSAHIFDYFKEFQS